MQVWGRSNERKVEMAGAKKQMPVVRLKVGEMPQTPGKPKHTVADLNNVRGNYRNYCHYRVDKSANFPPINAYPAANRSTRNNSVILILRGSQRPPSGSGFYNSDDRGSRRTGSPTSLVPFVRGRGSVRACSIPSQVRASQELHGYELRGSPLLRADGAPLEKSTKGSVTSSCVNKNRAVAAPTVTVNGVNLGDSLCVGAFQPPNTLRTSSAITHKREGTPEVTDLVLRDEYNAMANHAQPESRTTSRKVRFGGLQNPSYQGFMVPLDETTIRIGRLTTPLQLTKKNLEIFDYLSNPNNDPVSSYEFACRVDPRVIEWVYGLPDETDAVTDQSSEAMVSSHHTLDEQIKEEPEPGEAAGADYPDSDPGEKAPHELEAANRERQQKLMQSSGNLLKKYKNKTKPG